MRPRADQLSLFNDGALPVQSGYRWHVGFFTPSGKIKRVYYLFDPHSGRRALDARGRRRKFASYAAARRAGDELERQPRAI